MSWPTWRQPAIPLGTFGPPLLERRLKVPVHEIKTHGHVIGISGSGKSRFLAGLFLMLHNLGLAATLVDPHGDLARLILAHLVAQGFFNDPGAFARLRYLDLPTAERRGRFLPFNVLSQQLPPHTIASNFKEACHRAWPQLAGGAAPMFDTLIQDGVKVLISNHLPLPALYQMLTDKGFRDGLLQREEDTDVVAFFRQQFDRLAPRDQADQAGAALRRAHLLTFSPVLKYSLGQKTSAVDHRAMIIEGHSAVINLALGDAEARRLFGCLLTVFAEQGALSLADLAPGQREHHHFLILDEFAEFTAQSEESLARILSLCRKFGLSVVMAHQTWSQTSARLRGALQNVGIEVVFRLGREDAEYSARTMGRVNPEAIKHEVPDPYQVEKTHPLFYSLPEQWEAWVRGIQDLRPREAFLRRPNGKVAKMRTLSVPEPKVNPARLQAVEEYYLSNYFRPQQEIESEMMEYRVQANDSPTLTRMRAV